MKKRNLRIDMTPMVDLGFLLISFFVITAELSRPQAMDLYMPADGPPSELRRSDAMTVLLDKDNTIFCYYGDWQSAASANTITQTAYSGKNSLRNLIAARQKQLSNEVRRKNDKNGLMLLVKATPNASYENLVDVLDEIVITDVKKYAVVKISPEETEWLRQRQ